MKISEKLRKCWVFRWLFKVDFMAQEVVNKHKITRADLDQRLDSIAQATVNGEGEYFLQLVRKDPACAINVMNKCNLDGKH